MGSGLSTAISGATVQIGVAPTTTPLGASATTTATQEGTPAPCSSSNLVQKTREVVHGARERPSLTDALRSAPDDDAALLAVMRDYVLPLEASTLARSAACLRRRGTLEESVKRLGSLESWIGETVLSETPLAFAPNMFSYDGLPRNVEHWVLWGTTPDVALEVARFLRSFTRTVKRWRHAENLVETVQIFHAQVFLEFDEEAGLKDDAKNVIKAMEDLQEDKSPPPPQGGVEGEVQLLGENHEVGDSEDIKGLLRRLFREAAGPIVATSVKGGRSEAAVFRVAFGTTRAFVKVEEAKKLYMEYLRARQLRKLAPGHTAELLGTFQASESGLGAFAMRDLDYDMETQLQSATLCELWLGGPDSKLFSALNGLLGPGGVLPTLVRATGLKRAKRGWLVKNLASVNNLSAEEETVQLPSGWEEWEPVVCLSHGDLNTRNVVVTTSTKDLNSQISLVDMTRTEMRPVLEDPARLIIMALMECMLEPQSQEQPASLGEALDLADCFFVEECCFFSLPPKLNPEKYSDVRVRKTARALLHIWSYLGSLVASSALSNELDERPLGLHCICLLQVMHERTYNIYSLWHMKLADHITLRLIHIINATKPPKEAGTLIKHQETTQEEVQEEEVTEIIEEEKLCFDDAAALSAALLKSGVDVGVWGTGQAKTVQDLYLEIKSGESELFLSKGRILRRVSSIWAHLHFGQRELIEVEQKFLEDGRTRKRGKPLGEKMRPGETWQETVERGLREELGLEAGRDLDVASETHFEERSRRSAHSYPGLECEYLQHTAHCQLKSTHGGASEDRLKQIGVARSASSNWLLTSFKTQEHTEHDRIEHSWDWRELVTRGAVLGLEVRDGPKLLCVVCERRFDQNSTAVAGSSEDHQLVENNNNNNNQGRLVVECSLPGCRVFAPSPWDTTDLAPGYIAAWLRRELGVSCSSLDIKPSSEQGPVLSEEWAGTQTTEKGIFFKAVLSVSEQVIYGPTLSDFPLLGLPLEDWTASSAQLRYALFATDEDWSERAQAKQEGLPKEAGLYAEEEANGEEKKKKRRPNGQLERHAPLQVHPESSPLMSANAAEMRVLEALFPADCVQVRYKQLHGGMSGSVVLIVESWLTSDLVKQQPVVVKLDCNEEELERELNAAIRFKKAGGKAVNVPKMLQVRPVVVRDAPCEMVLASKKSSRGPLCAGLSMSLVGACWHIPELAEEKDAENLVSTLGSLCEWQSNQAQVESLNLDTSTTVEDEVFLFGSVGPVLHDVVRMLLSVAAGSTVVGVTTETWKARSNFARLLTHFAIPGKIQQHVLAFKQAGDVKKMLPTGAHSSSMGGSQFAYGTANNLFERYANVDRWSSLPASTLSTLLLLSEALAMDDPEVGPRDPRLQKIQSLWSPALSLQHGDLHCGNILVDVKEEVVFVDFALVRELPLFKDVAKLETVLLFKHTFLPLAPQDITDARSDDLIRWLHLDKLGIKSEGGALELAIALQTHCAQAVKEERSSTLVDELAALLPEEKGRRRLRATLLARVVGTSKERDLVIGEAELISEELAKAAATGQAMPTKLPLSRLAWTWSSVRELRSQSHRFLKPTGFRWDALALLFPTLDYALKAVSFAELTPLQQRWALHTAECYAKQILTILDSQKHELPLPGLVALEEQELLLNDQSSTGVKGAQVAYGVGQALYLKKTAEEQQADDESTEVQSPVKKQRSKEEDTQMMTTGVARDARLMIGREAKCWKRVVVFGCEEDNLLVKESTSAPGTVLSMGEHEKKEEKKCCLESLESLMALLESHNVPHAAWGTGASKTAADLMLELEARESELVVDDLRGGRLVRRVSSVWIELSCQGRALVEVKQRFLSEGRERMRNLPPGEKMRAGETWRETMLRGLSEELGLSGEHVEICESVVVDRSMRKPAFSYQ